ncbi:Mediator complex subunit 7 [Intoshia linei]|uniref:Mediator of RNA polymerase II transcription subunit 7 n=1 Tax=Intoshia linei TaxID=1819745 RepID=A0A177AX32_9BILA|nr:Mediator complex subunit 7 [Intoshia linei]
MSDKSKILYPLPPYQYIQNYTDEKLQANVAHLPPQLNVKKCSNFGVEYCLSLPPGESNIKTSLIKEIIKSEEPDCQNLSFRDRKQQLRDLLRRSIFTFLDLLYVIQSSPDSVVRLEKLNLIQTQFSKMNEIINSFRKHQAREQLVEMMKNQSSSRKSIISQINNQLNQSNQVVKKAKNIINLFTHPTELLNEADLQKFQPPKPQTIRKLSDLVVQQHPNAVKMSIDNLICTNLNLDIKP